MSMQSWLYFPSKLGGIDIAYSRYPRLLEELYEEIWVSGRNGSQSILLSEKPPSPAFTIGQKFGFDADPDGTGYVAIIAYGFYSEGQGLGDLGLNLKLQTNDDPLIDWTSDRNVPNYIIFSNQVATQFSLSAGNDLLLSRPDGSTFTGDYTSGFAGFLLFPGITDRDILSPVITESEIRNLRYSIELNNAIFRKTNDIWHIDNTGTTTKLNISEAELLTATPIFTAPQYHYRHPILYVINVPDAYTSGTATVYANVIDLDAETMVLIDTLSVEYTGTPPDEFYEVLQYVYYP